MAKLERLLKKARAQQKKGKSQKALDLFREACEEAPHDPDVWLERAGVAEELKGKEEAVESLFHAADLYARAGLSGEAAEIAERVLEINPKHGGAKRFVRMMRGRGRPTKVEARGKGKAAKEKAAKEKPAKHEAEEEKAAAAKKAEEEKAAKEKAEEEKAAKEKAAEEEKAAEDKKAEEEKAAAAKKAEEEKAAEEKAEEEKAAEEKAAEEEKAAAGKKAEEEKAAKKKAEEEKVEEEKAAEEKAAEDRAAKEKAEAEKAAEEKAAKEKAAKEKPSKEEPVEKKAAKRARGKGKGKGKAKGKADKAEPASMAEAAEKAAALEASADSDEMPEGAEDADEVDIDIQEEDYAAVSIEERKPESVWEPPLTAGMRPDDAPEEPEALDAALRTKARAGAEPSRPVEHRMGRVTGEIALGDLSLAAMLEEAEEDKAAEFPLDDEDDMRLVQAVAATVTSSPLLSELDSDLVKYLIDCGRVTRILRGKAVFMEGESGSSLYLILEGSVDVERSDPETGRVRRLASLRRGAFFGEMALITDAPRSATVRSRRDATLLEVSRDAVLGLVKRENRVLKLLMRFFRARLVGNLLATSPLFNDFDIDARRQIVRQFRLRELPGGFEVLQKDRRSDGLYLVLAGDLVAFLPELEGGEQLLGELGPGDVFGEMSLLEGTTATASIRAVVRSWVLRLPREEFAKLIAEHPLLLEQLGEIAESRRQANVETLRTASVRPV